MQWSKICQIIIILSEEFRNGFLELLKEKEAYLYKYKDSFREWSGYKLPNRCEFFASLKSECISSIDTLGDYHDL